ncbi:MAG: helix-turn-helix domain-containing protein [Thermotogota bacterium]|nr:helix-turn-helix domain-containing protein [Thermotogota bacterium]
MNKEYYTVQQISQLLDLHEKTIQRYIREGKIKAKKVGKSWRVTKENLDEFTGTDEEEDDGSVKGIIKKGIEKRVMISAVVDVDECTREEAIRISNQVHPESV